MTDTVHHRSHPVDPSNAAGRTRSGTGPPLRGTVRRWVVIAAAATVGFTVAALFIVAGNDDATHVWQTADVGHQGTTDAVYAADSAQLQRREDGLLLQVEMPVPEAGSYDYPTADMVPPWVETHPPVSRGAQDAPEVFTLWLFAFNTPSGCTDDRCDSDDIGVDTAARGGVHQVDGRVADGDTLRFVGNVRRGQQPLDGSTLIDPVGAEVHIAIAPHGRIRSGDEGVIQLNTPVGNPTLWWGARFPPPS